MKRLLAPILAGILALTAFAGPASAYDGTWHDIAVYGYVRNALGQVAVRSLTTYYLYWNGSYWSKTASTHSCSVFVAGWSCSYYSGTNPGATSRSTEEPTSATYKVSSAVQTTYPYATEWLNKDYGIRLVSTWYYSEVDWYRDGRLIASWGG